ncbi:MAG: 16S rRNA (cytidine(1402)-2'-O)-methyltransferase [Vicinamibacterales bacterium]
MPGTLFVVATPIGNLEDLTFRALRTLREVDVIAAEDTRRTSKLLAHYEIRKPLVSLREHNEAVEAPRLVQRIRDGIAVALVTDAGTPGISDPGARLVRGAQEAGLRIVPIAGPSAVTAALSVSGFSADRFTFLGFPPPSGAARERWFDDLAEEPGVVVLFESPHRVARTLEELRMVNRPIVVLREGTKLNEELVVSPTEVREQGEFTFVVGSAPSAVKRELDPEICLELFDRFTRLAGFDEVDAGKLTAALLDVPPATMKRTLKKAKIAAKRLADPAS